MKIKIIFVIWMLWKGAFAIEVIGYNCEKDKLNFKTISLLTTEDCQEELRNIKEEEKTIQILQAKTAAEVPFINCFIKVKSLVTGCGSWFSSPLALDNYETMVDISESDCEAIHRTKVFIDARYPNIRVHLRNGKASFRGVIAGSNQDGCKGSTFVTHDGLTKIECTPTLPALYRINTTWYRQIEKHLVPTNEPEQLRATTIDEMNVRIDDKAAFKGIFSKEELQDYLTAIRLPISMHSNINNFILGAEGRIPMSHNIRLSKAMTSEDI